MNKKTFYSTIALSTLTNVLGCSSAERPTQPLDAGPGEQTHALESGAIVPGATGVVEFTSSVSACTGTMIRDNAIVTAAHCFKALGAGVNAWSGPSTFSIWYHDPVSGRRLVYQGSATWFAYPTYNGAHGDAGAANSDTALIVIPGIFEGTDHRDYLRIYADGDDPLYGQLTAFGAGFFDDQGSVDDLLRMSNYNVENVDLNHIVVDQSDTVHVCHGDSGGPLYKFANRAGVSVPTIVAVLAQSEGNGDNPDTCYGTSGPWDDDAFYSKLSWIKLGWVESTVGTACSSTDQFSDLRYRRCFSVPFINNLSEGGLSPNVATAVAMAIQPWG